MSEQSEHEPDALQRSRQVWLALFGCLALGSLIIGCFCPGPDRDGHILYLGLAMGFFLGGIPIVAIWLSWESFAYRIAVAIFFHFALMIAFGVYIARVGGPTTFIIIGCVTILIQSLLTQLPLWILRIRSGYRFASSHGTVDETSKPQFSIANVLVITTVLALVMALGRTLFSEFGFGDGSASGTSRTLEWITLFSLSGLGSVMFTLAALWYMSSRRKTTLAIGFFLWLALMATQVFHFSNLAEIYESTMFGISLHVTIALVIGTSLLALYRSGRRVTYPLSS